MVPCIPSPDPRTLLPPLLACLPIAFASPRPPPALLPLLTPILRQRVQFLSPSAASTSDTWLSLLCWKASQTEKLVDVIENGAFEPHPVSGEIEYQDLDDIKYRRLDEETLQAMIGVPNLELAITYLWCQADDGGGGSGWRVAEINPTEVNLDVSGDCWWATIGEANEKAQKGMSSDSLEQFACLNHQVPINANVQDDEDDDEYWAQYNSISDRLPANSRFPMDLRDASIDHDPEATSEADYYAHYQYVQPALDNDDPSGPHEFDRASSLDDSVIEGAIKKLMADKGAGISSPQCLTNGTDKSIKTSDISHQKTSLSSSSSSSVIGRARSSAAPPSILETPVQQHISTSIKNLYRLARSTGIERKEFVQVIRAELDTLCMWSEDE